MRLALIGVLLVGLAGCGGGSDEDQPAPTNTAATVGDRVITETDLDRAIDVVFPHQGGYAKAFGPPGYPACVKAKGDIPNAKQQCKTEFGVIRAQTLAFLLRAEWARRDAKRMNVAAEASGTLREQADVRLDALQGAIPVREEEIARYARDNAFVYADSERRVVRIVQTTSRKRALAARSALASGTPLRAVVARYSERPLERTVSGRHEVRKESAPNDAFGDGVFTAPVGELRGPVETLNGWYVYEVERISHRASNRLSNEARTSIRHTLQTKQLDERLHGRYASETTCAKRYRVPEVPQCV